MKRAGPLYGVIICTLILGISAVEDGTCGERAARYLAALSERSLHGYASQQSPLGQGPRFYVTEHGYVAAMEENLLDEAIYRAGVGSEEDFIRFLDSTPHIFPLKGGIRVYLEGFSFSGKVKIRPQGSQISVWTIREAIRTEIPF